MLTQVSKRINQILQFQQSKGQQKKNDTVNKSRISTMEPPLDRFNSSGRKEKQMTRNNSKSLLPPKSAHDVFYNSPRDKELLTALTSSNKKALERSSSNAMNIEIFLSLYKQEILSFVRPFLAELEQRITHRIQKLEYEIRVLSQSERNTTMPHLQIKSATNYEYRSEIDHIIVKAQQIVSKIDQNQIKVVSRFKEIEDNIRQVRTKAFQKCSCFGHLQSLLQTQSFLCQQIKQIKHHRGIF